MDWDVLEEVLELQDVHKVGRRGGGLLMFGHVRWGAEWGAQTVGGPPNVCDPIEESGAHQMFGAH